MSENTVSENAKSNDSENKVSHIADIVGRRFQCENCGKIYTIPKGQEIIEDEMVCVKHLPFNDHRICGKCKEIF